MRDVIDAYIGQFNILYEGDPWLDETFRGKFKNLTEEEKFDQPYGLLSVAEEVWHLHVWRDVTLKRLQGEIIPFDDVPNFKSIKFLKELGWDRLMQYFNTSHQALIKWLSDQNDDVLKNTYHDTGMDFQYYLEGLIHHDAYHMGQIGLVLKLIRNAARQRMEAH